jgi:hypothetical protein
MDAQSSCQVIASRGHVAVAKSWLGGDDFHAYVSNQGEKTMLVLIVGGGVMGLSLAVMWCTTVFSEGDTDSLAMSAEN